MPCVIVQYTRTYVHTYICDASIVILWAIACSAPTSGTCCMLPGPHAECPHCPPLCRVWDVHSGEMLNTLLHHCEAVLHLRFNSHTMVTCSKVGQRVGVSGTLMTHTSSQSIALCVQVFEHHSFVPTYDVRTYVHARPNTRLYIQVLVVWGSCTLLLFANYWCRRTTACLPPCIAHLPLSLAPHSSLRTAPLQSGTSSLQRTLSCVVFWWDTELQSMWLTLMTSILSLLRETGPSR